MVEIKTYGGPHAGQTIFVPDPPPMIWAMPGNASEIDTAPPEVAYYRLSRLVDAGRTIEEYRYIYCGQR